MTEFEKALLKEVSRVRKIFADRDVSECIIRIEATGPSMRNEMKITFAIDGTWEDKEVKGATLDACLDEFFRRRGWQKANEYLALPNVEA